MTKIGDILTQPESEMIRFEDDNSNITYIGPWTLNNNSSYSNSYRHICQNSYNNPKIKFNFIGNKIYLISSIYPSYSGNIEIKIDNNIVEYFSEAFGNIAGCCVCYINNNLNFREHYVEITKIQQGSYMVDFILDAIDINNNGILKPYNSNIYKFFIQDDNNLCNTDNVGLFIRDTLPYTFDKFNTYGMDDLSNINETVINKINNDKYNIGLLK